MLRIDGIHQVGIVHHYLRGLFREILSYGVDDVYKPCVGKIFYVVHYRCPAGVHLLGQLADVGSFWTIHGNKIEQLLYLCEILQLYLFYEEDIHLNHHVHGFEQVLGEIPVLKEEGVETMMDIVLEMFYRTCLWQYLLDDMLMVFDNLVKRIRSETVACLQIEIFTERKASKVVAFHYATNLRVLLLQSHYA